MTGKTYGPDNTTVISKGDCDGSCGEAIRMGKYKLIVGNPGTVCQ
jgi:hypothetical protein